MTPSRRWFVLASVAASGASLYACGLTVEGSAPDKVAADAPGGPEASPIGEASSDAPVVDAPADVDPLGEAEAAVDAGPPVSCKDVLARDPSRKGMSSVYSIQPVGHGGAPLDVYCEMSIDNGGWTLVGRSAPSGVAAFGWKSAAGNVTDEAKPYSLDTAAAKLLFREVLISDSMTGALVATRAYKIGVPADFLAAHGNNTISGKPVVTLLGGCTPDPTTMMLQYVGATDHNDVFFFRDLNNITQHTGLTAAKWEVTYGDCPKGADLDQKQGAIFVR